MLLSRASVNVPSHTAAYPPPVTQATALIGHDGRFSRDSKGPLEFAFLGGPGAGTMLARSPSEDWKK